MSDAYPEHTLPAADGGAGQEETAPSRIDRLLADQRERWGRGDWAPVEMFLEQCPALRDDSEGLLCLIFNEVILREERGESPGVEEFQRRFPHLAASIALQFALDQALRPDLPGPATLPAAADAPSAPGGPARAPQLPGYEILGELGRGGMGVVYKARQLGFNRVVAVKMILAGAGLADREERFRVEAEAVARLQHPHIVQVHEVGEHEGKPFFSMEFCPGGSLDKKLNGTPLPSKEAAALVEKLARAVEAAHLAQVIHRDLKPANVLLTGDGTPKVTDFGLAKKLDEEGAQTQSGSVMGTPSYMAPEQAGGKLKGIGPAADVYALGAILYECLTGRPPFKAATLLETLAQVVADDPVPPRRLQRKTPRDLETICLKCLQKEPARRYPTARALADDLRRFLAGEPVRARPVGAPERAWKWVRTHKAQAGLAAAAGTVLLLLAFVTWRAVAQSRDLTRRAEQDLNEASRLMEEARWGEARAAVRQAQDRSTQAGASDLLRKAQQVSDDLETAAKLEEAPLLRTAPGREGWDFESANRAYRDAFAGYDLDPETRDPASAAARIRASAIKDGLTEALDDWLLSNQRGDDSLHQWLFAVVQQADPDEWRCRVRKAALENDREGLGRLADDPETDQLSPAMTVLLSEALIRTGGRYKALRLLRAAQQKVPDHFWINYNIGYNLDQTRGPVQEEAIGFLRAALALRPQNPGVHLQLGSALQYREKFAEAEAEYRKAVEIRPDLAAAHSSLGYVLMDRGRAAEAEAECRKALEIQPDSVAAHSNLGYVLREQGRVDEAEAQCRKALEIRPTYASAHNGLGNVFNTRGRFDEAEAEFRKAVESRPNYAQPHRNLGALLASRGRFDAAEAEFRKALQIKPNYTSAHNGLGKALTDQGRFAEALEAARRWQQEVPVGEAPAQAAAKEIRECERILGLDATLPAVLRGDVQPDSAHEKLEYGRLCWWKKLYAAAVRFYSDAFAADPSLAEDPSTVDRYNGACAASLAGCGQGGDAAQASDEDRARWRRQALEWLEADLAQWGKRQESDDPKAQALVVGTMRHWQIDPDLAGVRESEGLAKLPEAEREPWRKLWTGVEALLERARTPGWKGR